MDDAPNRRELLRFKFLYSKRFKCYGSVGFHPATGAPYELFLQVGKSGTDLEAASRDAAILCSKALQHGATVEELRTAMTRLEIGAPTSPVALALDILAVELKRRETPEAKP